MKEENQHLFRDKLIVLCILSIHLYNEEKKTTPTAIANRKKSQHALQYPYVFSLSL